MPRPGDLIAFSRLGYQHWGVYVGGGYVVHLVKDDNSDLPIYKLDRWVRNCQVMKEKLEDVAGDDKWQVNNTRDQRKTPLPAEVIVRTALSQVGKRVYYRIFQYNCEHFAKELRYGEATSQQVVKVLVGVGVIALGTLAVVYIGPGTIAKAAITGARIIFSVVANALRAAPTGLLGFFIRRSLQ